MADPLLLYFGRSNIVHLTSCEGEFIPARYDEVLGHCEEKTCWDFAGTLQSSFPSVLKGSSIAFPQVPSKVPILHKLDHNPPSFPDILSKPICKEISSNLASNTTMIEGFTSGARSCIIKCDGDYYRLKGCGNGIENSKIEFAFPGRTLGHADLLAFPPRENITKLITSLDLIDIRPQNEKKEEKMAVEIRGCVFDFTAKREIALTSIVNRSLSNHKIPLSNLPIGYYSYYSLDLKDSTNAEKKVEICCSIFKTFGDKRLSSHLLWGLDLLLPMIFKLPSFIEDTEIKEEKEKIEDGNIVQFDYSNPSKEPNAANDIKTTFPKKINTYKHNWISKLFPPSRNDGEMLFESGMTYLTNPSDLIDLTSLTIHDSIDSNINSHETTTRMTSSWTDSSKENSIGEIPKFPSDISGSGDSSFPSSKWKSLWEEEWKHLHEESKSSGKTVGQMLAELYRRLGLEVGQILKIIHRSHVNWGTFDDMLGQHCNSHPNNLIILNPYMNSHHQSQPRNNQTKLSSCRLLSALDFDLAYTQSMESPSCRTCEPSWEEKLEIETNAMGLALGGDSINSGVQGLAPLATELSPLRTAFRDTMLKSFIQAYRVDDPLPSEEELPTFFTSFVNLSLILTENIIS